MLTIIQTKSFKNDYKRILRSGRYDLDDLKEIVFKLESGIELDERNREHRLVGEWIGCFECHIRPDWLLIYERDDFSLTLHRAGSHSELFD